MAYDSNNPISIDRSIAFLDNRDIFFDNVDKTSSVDTSNRNTWVAETIEGNNITLRNYNYFENRTFDIVFFPGYGSAHTNNQILNSEKYKLDLRYSNNIIKPFLENETYQGNPLNAQTNTLVVKKTYGSENPDPLFEKISDEPFEDVGNIEDPVYFLSMPNEIKYPKYFNHYSISKLNSNISVFGTIEEIDGTILSEKPLRGITCEFISSGTDSRERSINIAEKTRLFETQNHIESYSDEEYEDLVTGSDVLLKRSFKYVTKEINGSVYTVVDSSESAFSFYETLSNKIIFYTEDKNNIIPFTDRWNEDEVERFNSEREVIEYDNSDQYPTHGVDRDNSQGTGPDSISYVGAQD